MIPIQEIIHRLIQLRSQGVEITLLAVCPNSAAVLEAAVKAAAANRTPMLFAATLNQVDLDGGYTGWTPAQFTLALRDYAKRYHWDGPLYPCLDHGGPWLKDRHTLAGLSFQATFDEVRRSLTACLEAGYQLLHIDVTVDRTLPPGEHVPLPALIERTVSLIAYAEAERQRLGLPPVAYEVGSEEVHGGLVDYRRFIAFLDGLRQALQAQGLLHAWPSFIVTQVGTDLHTTRFDASAARQLYPKVAALGSLLKGHYTDWVENPAEYPASGMGGANVGPEFTAAEFEALADLCRKEASLRQRQPELLPSRLMEALEQAVVTSGRWKKWLLPEEQGLAFAELSPARRLWLTQTGARYIWTDPAVQEARQRLYENLAPHFPDPHGYVISRIERAIDQYINSFNLFASLPLFS